MNRIERISAILIQLQSKKVVTASEIADHFKISLRTVYRDIRALEETGVPIAAEAGYGYSLAEGYKLPPVSFTQDEATAFITAGKLIEKLTDEGISSDFKTALMKIRAVLRSGEKDHLETLDNRIAVVGNRYLPDNRPNERYMNRIISAISTRSVLEMEYFGGIAQQRTSRNIEPVGIFFMSSRWHFIAYCHLRKDYRHFRLDRVIKLASTREPFLKKHPSLKSFLDRLTHEQELTRVELEIDKDAVGYLGDQVYYNGFVSQKKLDKVVHMTFLTPSLEGMARWYMMFGDHARVLAPEELKTRVNELMTGLKKNIHSSVSY